MQFVQSFEIQIGPIRDVDYTRFRDKVIKNIDIVNVSIGDPYESRDVASQIKEGVQFYSTL